jgi:hypothetical protein
MKLIKDLAKQMLFGMGMITLIYAGYLGFVALSKIVFTFLGTIFNIF